MAIMYSADDVGINGISLSKDVSKEAGTALRKAMMRVAPRVLTWRQVGEAAMWWARQRCAQLTSGWQQGCMPPYSPSFEEPLQHFLILAGTRNFHDTVQDGFE